MLVPLALISFSLTSTAVEEIEVRGARPLIVQPDPSASTAQLDRTRLERAAREGIELSTLLDAVAGARVFDLGGPVSEKKLSLRGGGFDETLIIVDGVVLSSPFANGLDLDLFGVDALESVELVRGGAGATFGDGALSGAMLLTTRRPARDPEGSVSLAYGAFETVRASASAAANYGALSATFERTRGNFPYVSQLVALPDREEIRENSDATKGAASLFLEKRLTASTVSLSLGGAMREGGVPGLETQEQLHAREAKKTALVRGTFATSLDRRLRATFGVSGSLLDIDYEDELAAERSSTAFHAFGADSTIALIHAPGQLLRAVVAFSEELSDSTIHGTPSRSRVSAALSEELLFGELSLFGAMRVEKVDGQSFAVLPRAGLAFRVAEPLLLRAGIGRSLRSPAIDELYHPPEAGFSGNPELRSETAWEAELGATLTPHPVLEISTTVFGRLVYDGILYLNQNAFLVRPENFGDARAAGGELEVSLADRLFGLDVSLAAAGSLFLSRLSEGTGPIPARPPWSVAMRAAVSAPEVFGLHAAGVSLAQRALGETWANLAATQRIDLFLRTDLAVFVEPTSASSIALSVTNLFDDRTLETLHKLPLPGRAAFLTVRVATDRITEGP